MKVYYDSGLGNGSKGLAGLPHNVNWQFEYAGTKRYIPSIYSFPKGIVFDIISILDDKKFHEFFTSMSY